MQQIIEIANMYGPKVKVSATVRGGLALHRQAGIGRAGDVRLAADTWTITHVASGGAMLTVAGYKAAWRAFQRCRRYRLHGVALGEMSGCEICANALRLNADLSAKPSAAPVVLAIAAEAAEWLACGAGSEGVVQP